jgi:hypothetical protein
MLTLQPKGVQKKSEKKFQIEDFFHLPPVSLTPVAISPRIFEKIRNGPYVLSGARGKLIHEKTQKQKIS